jgi:hypothetical protein
MARNAHSSPGPQDYQLVDRRFPLQGDSFEELLIRETRALALMEARLALAMSRAKSCMGRGSTE